jgi:hypothetical protein
VQPPDPQHVLAGGDTLVLSGLPEALALADSSCTATSTSARRHRRAGRPRLHHRQVVAYELNVGFVPIRKKGKLPFTTVEETYELEYGSATVEMHTDAVRPATAWC